MKEICLNLNELFGHEPGRIPENNHHQFKGFLEKVAINCLEINGFQLSYTPMYYYEVSILQVTFCELRELHWSHGTVISVWSI